MRGRVLAQDAETPIVGADVDTLLWFTIDSPGNQRAPSTLTDEEGRFETIVRIVASCEQAFFCGTEAQATRRAPGSVRLTIQLDGSERNFHISGRDFVTSLVEEVPRFGIVGVVELPDVVLASD